MSGWRCAFVVATSLAAMSLATLSGVCLDDVVVGVRSLGADGSRSRVATPPEPDRFEQRPRRSSADPATEETR